MPGLFLFPENWLFHLSIPLSNSIMLHQAQLQQEPCLTAMVHCKEHYCSCYKQRSMTTWHCLINWLLNDEVYWDERIMHPRLLIQHRPTPLFSKQDQHNAVQLPPVPRQKTITSTPLPTFFPEWPFTMRSRVGNTSSSSAAATAAQ